jgi:hypothetical protein
MSECGFNTLLSHQTNGGNQPEDDCRDDERSLAAGQRGHPRLHESPTANGEIIRRIAEHDQRVAAGHEQLAAHSEKEILVRFHIFRRKMPVAHRHAELIEWRLLRNRCS